MRFLLKSHNPLFTQFYSTFTLPPLAAAPLATAAAPPATAAASSAGDSTLDKGEEMSDEGEEMIDEGEESSDDGEEMSDEEEKTSDEGEDDVDFDLVSRMSEMRVVASIRRLVPRPADEARLQARRTIANSLLSMQMSMPDVWPKEREVLLDEEEMEAALAVYAPPTRVSPSCPSPDKGDKKRKASYSSF